MKKILLASTLAAALLCSCAKKELTTLDVIDGGRKYHLEFTTDTHGDTKTVYDETDNKALWKSSDRIGVISEYMVGGGRKLSSGGKIQPFSIQNPSGSAMSTATFEGTLQMESSSSYSYYFVYPYQDSFSGTAYTSAQMSALELTLPSTQYPSATSWDASCDFLVGKPIVTGTIPESALNIQFARVFSMYHPYSGTFGNGTSISYFPVNSNSETFTQVLHHEACGHGFAKLADEYFYDYMGTVPSDYVSQIQTQQNSWGLWKNADFTNDLSAIRWNYFINDTRYANEGLGAFEGGLTYPTGVYRPTDYSIMRFNTGGFNAPSREAIWTRINKLAYGDSWVYNYEDFVAYDAINRNTQPSVLFCADGFFYWHTNPSSLYFSGTKKTANCNESPHLFEIINNHPRFL